MNNSEYWRKRQEELIESLLRPAEDYTEEIGKGYAEAIKEIQKQIAMWFMRFADNNKIDLVTALKLLNNDELQEFKWTVEEYIAKAKADGITGDFARELENASAKVHISRLEALKLQTRAELEKLYAGRADKVQELLGSIYQESILKNGYEHYKRTGIETTFTTIGSRQLEQIVKKPWTVDGLNFSDRIWRDKDKLIKTLNTELTNAAARGEAPIKTADRIAQALNADKRNARRLVFTESAYFATKGQGDCYRELEVDEFENVCTLDGLTCDTCGSYDGKHYPVEEMQAGVNAPPFHPNCRCTTVPYFDDEFTEGEKRAARDENGNSVLVDDMTYKEWREKYVVNLAESGIIKSIDIDDFMDMAESYEIKQEVSEVIANTLKEFEDKGGMYISDVHFGNFYDETTGKRALFQVLQNAFGLTEMNVNSEILAGRTVEEIDKQIENTPINIARLLREAVIHECGHAKAYYKKSAKEIAEMNKILENRGVAGISPIAEVDGAECIAEVEVLLYRGEKVPTEALSLYYEWVGGKSK